eukprot:CAMPEP_0201285524 /NCGR_PEP_ID=MMETSP1317-20130820/110479_1 /ASSEMBLY_ACC=CAM_ASM_000770 /TAXON_ID=187299 /ORGANISM="Undescribed Undescribed, Strain Undescribed" /LENGTH=43 /DNA_ID= /DNA_START= /DNA_END= /DNA_ORIENTATION=
MDGKTVYGSWKQGSISEKAKETANWKHLEKLWLAEKKKFEDQQ